MDGSASMSLPASRFATPTPIRQELRQNEGAIVIAQIFNAQLEKFGHENHIQRM